VYIYTDPHIDTQIDVYVALDTQIRRIYCPETVLLHPPPPFRPTCLPRRWLVSNAQRRGRKGLVLRRRALVGRRPEGAVGGEAGIETGTPPTNYCHATHEQLPLRLHWHVTLAVWRRKCGRIENVHVRGRGGRVGVGEKDLHTLGDFFLC